MSLLSISLIQVEGLDNDLALDLLFIAIWSGCFPGSREKALTKCDVYPIAAG
ncbi:MULTISPECIES: hypothetical protein [Shewanella]|jgi:hypothetical protein|uniref:hypothetical protein n=1 Tax=Shewanella TaxID=22 RepID=UPI003006DD5A